MPDDRPQSLDRIDRMRAHIREHVGPDQAYGIEIASLVRMVANQYETLAESQNQTVSLSGPRWGVLLRLMGEEKRGNFGITPTLLSQGQNVSKNTISALLRGLEEQGLVSRELDPADRRVFRIHLTPKGRSLIHETTPQRMRWLNQLSAGLSTEEKQQLANLLTKLYCSITSCRSMEAK